jgi:PAS domain S-box-containing protein
MARPAPASRGARPWPFPLSWRRVTGRLLGSLWLRATGTLLLASSLTLPLPIVAIVHHRQALAAGGRALSEARLQADIRRVRLAVAGEAGAVRGYVLTGDPALVSDYDRSRSQAAIAWSDASADAGDSGLQAELAPVRSELDDWQTWADGRLRPAGAGQEPPGPAALRDGDRRRAGFLAASGRLDALAAAGAARDGAGSDALHRAAANAGIAGVLLGDGAIVAVAAILLVLARRPVTRLAEAAIGLAGGARTSVPYTDRRDEVGSLARALTRWRQAEVSRRAIVDHSSIGLFTLGPDLRLVDANPAVQEMFGVPPDDPAPAELDSFVHPDDLEAVLVLQRRLASGACDHARLEVRCVRGDGAVFWSGLTVAVVRDVDATPSQYVCMIEDVSGRREQLERAARVQRDLLPGSAPELDGYELAGLCRPSLEMGGDFYDWQLREPGILTLTLGDVMGKDMPAALLMATVCVALRSSATLPTVGEAVRSVAASAGRDLNHAGAFVTLFHGRLDLRTGLLTYVDAGHGLALVVGKDGAHPLARGTSLPLGVLEGEVYEESSVRLEPGQALLVFSDGVLDVHRGLEARLETTGDLLVGAGSAREMAERLASGRGAVNDDVTVVVLRRRHAG